MELHSLFDCSLNWLKSQYVQQGPFYYERDLVWTVQKKLGELIRKHTSGDLYRVFSEYPIDRHGKNVKQVDLAICQSVRERQNQWKANFIAEFKYVPSKNRDDVLPTSKYPPIFWKDVETDVKKVAALVQDRKVQTGWFIFIDEGGYFHEEKKNIIDDGMAWEEWNNETWVLVAKYESVSRTNDV